MVIEQMGETGFEKRIASIHSAGRKPHGEYPPDITYVVLSKKGDELSRTTDEREISC
jgi:hypothetical protein